MMHGLNIEDSRRKAPGSLCDDPAASEVLAALARGAGLSDALERFPRAGTLRERLERARYLMAPMAGVSDAAYRMMARAGGAGLAYSEMVSVAGIHYEGEKTWDLVIPRDPEPDLAVQLFGSKPDQFREAAAQVSERLGDRLALIDINMACPVPKVTKKGEGSALLDEPELAADIVRACVREASVPVTCKIRRSRRPGPEQAPDFARALEQAGASAVAVHGRCASQLYRGEADWSVVRHVVDAVSIPIIGSGDVLSAESASRMRAETGASAVMVARGTYGNPWIFGSARLVDAGKPPKEPSALERISAFECHVRLLAATGAHLARARSLAGWYFKGMPHAAAWRNNAMSCVLLEDFLKLARDLRLRALEG
ncbi:tRNA-U20-dihydrouridine synthase [Olsenella sp. KH1P3]|uniref:tRNA-dihydrouridine synthase n=2 Tax=Coriobacteriales TaxID=84999 RepID=A0A1H6JHN4_9ACTN|nr:tRNA-U20-dihydrouridine synthase [Parafannyhessea umbonata]SJZ79464.1 tRNA-U20-dihydrouridine synthase [Olsenella sp. KH1P3]